MTSTGTKRSTIPETDHPGWAAWHEATRIVEVEYVGKMEAVAFRFGDGRILGVPLRELEGSDATPVTRVRIAYDGDEAIIEQFSGNRLEVPWDVVLYHADPTYPIAALIAQRPWTGTGESSGTFAGPCPFAPLPHTRYRGPDDTDRQRHPA